MLSINQLIQNHMRTAQKIILNPNFMIEVFEDEILLYAISTGKGVYLNKTAGLVREMCGNGYTLEEIIALLEEAFPEQRNDIRLDVKIAIETLLEHGALLYADQQSDE